MDVWRGGRISLHLHSSLLLYIYSCFTVESSPNLSVWSLFVQGSVINRLSNKEVGQVLLPNPFTDQRRNRYSPPMEMGISKRELGQSREKRHRDAHSMTNSSLSKLPTLPSTPLPYPSPSLPSNSYPTISMGRKTSLL